MKINTKDRVSYRVIFSVFKCHVTQDGNTKCRKEHPDCDGKNDLQLDETIRKPCHGLIDFYFVGTRGGIAGVYSSPDKKQLRNLMDD